MCALHRRKEVNCDGEEEGFPVCGDVGRGITGSSLAPGAGPSFPASCVARSEQGHSEVLTVPIPTYPCLDISVCPHFGRRLVTLQQL